MHDSRSPRNAQPTFVATGHSPYHSFSHSVCSLARRTSKEIHPSYRLWSARMSLSLPDMFPPLSSIDTTLSSIDADDSFTSVASCDSCPSSPASANSPTKPTLPFAQSDSAAVIHYMDVSLPAYKQVLARKSAYFAVHPRLLPSFNSCAVCGPASCCLALPPLYTMHSKLRITEQQLRHFLCQLHFPAHYYCPPLSPPSNIDLDSSQPPSPLSYSYPPPSQLSQAIEWDGFELADSLDVEAFLTLAHRFQCTALLARCDDILLHFYSQLPSPVDLWMAWDRLVPAHCFELAKLRTHCLQLVSRDTRMDGEYEESRLALKRQAGEQLYQQLMDEVGDMILSRVHTRICRHRTSLVGKAAVRAMPELA